MCRVNVLLLVSTIALYRCNAKAVMSIYLRIKRHKTTLFTHCEPTDTIASLKAKVASQLVATNSALPASGSAAGKNIRLLVDSNVTNANAQAGAVTTTAATGTGTTAGASMSSKAYTPLDDSVVIEHVGLKNDDVVYLTFLLGDGNVTYKQTSQL